MLNPPHFLRALFAPAHAWPALTAGSSATPSTGPPSRTLHGWAERRGPPLAAKRDLGRFLRRLVHTRTSSGSHGGRRGGFHSTEEAADWLTPEAKKQIRQLIGLRRDITHDYSALDAILYHLSVGKSAAQPRATDHKYLDEHDPDFTVMPLFGTIPAQRGIKEIMENDLKIEFSKLLLGEHYFQLYRPIPKAAQVHSIIQLADITTNGKDAVFIFDVATRDGNENFLMYNQFCYSVKGAGGIGKDRCSDKRIPIMPHYFLDQYPTSEALHTTTADQQAALFRLTGETNPYLMDPNLAEKMDYSHPPLDGVCSIGIVANVLQEHYRIPQDKFKGIKVQFSAPLFPGETMQIWAWRFYKNVIFFNTMSKQSGDMVHTGGYLTTY